MAGKSGQLEEDYLRLIFLNTTISGVGDATGIRGSSSAGSFYASLHTADPGEGGYQSTYEISYTGYSRITLNRSGTYFSIVARSGSTPAYMRPANIWNFPYCTSSGTVRTGTHLGLGTASSGSGKLLYSIPLHETVYTGAVDLRPQIGPYDVSAWVYSHSSSTFFQPYLRED